MAEPKPRKKAKVIDFDRRRYAAFKIAYLGGAYDGFAIQENTPNTVEGKLFEALAKATLIKDFHSSGYSRCGRTDKGVSALGNAVSLYVRSRAGHALGEYDYVTIVNKLLPEDIRLVSYCYPDESFDARFSCLYREYKYFFCLEDMDFSQLCASVGRYRGEHDYRNFCKMDIVNVSNFRRRIVSARVERLTEAGPMTMCVLTLRGFAFLWHQVRCMAAVLFLIGLGKEAPEVIDKLLDIEANPQKPTYDLAPEAPLLLYDCGFESVDFLSEPEALNRTYETFAAGLSRHSCTIAMYSTILGHFDRTLLTSGRLLSDSRADLVSRSSKVYTPLLFRPRTETYEDRVGGLKGKKAARKAEKVRPKA